MHAMHACIHPFPKMMFTYLYLEKFKTSGGIFLFFSQKQSPPPPEGKKEKITFFSSLFGRFNLFLEGGGNQWEPMGGGGSKLIIRYILKYYVLTAIFVAAVRLSEVVPREVGEGVALPPERAQVGQHPGQEAVRGPRAGVKLGGHSGGRGGQPADGKLRGDT